MLTNSRAVDISEVIGLIVQHIIGLDTTTRHALEFLLSRISLLSKDGELEMECDPYRAEYIQFPPALLKLMLRVEVQGCGAYLKFEILHNWVVERALQQEEEGEADKGAVLLELLATLKFKLLDDKKLEEVAQRVRNYWDLEQSELLQLTNMVEAAKKERQEECEMKKSLKERKQSLLLQRHRRGHHFHFNLDMFEIAGGPEVFLDM